MVPASNESPGVSRESPAENSSSLEPYESHEKEVTIGASSDISDIAVPEGDVSATTTQHEGEFTAPTIVNVTATTSDTHSIDRDIPKADEPVTNPASAMAANEIVQNGDFSCADEVATESEEQPPPVATVSPPVQTEPSPASEPITIPEEYVSTNPASLESDGTSQTDEKEVRQSENQPEIGNQLEGAFSEAPLAQEKSAAIADPESTPRNIEIKSLASQDGYESVTEGQAHNDVVPEVFTAESHKTPEAEEELPAQEPSIPGAEPPNDVEELPSILGGIGSTLASLGSAIAETVTEKLAPVIQPEADQNGELAPAAAEKFVVSDKLNGERVTAAEAPDTPVQEENPTAANAENAEDL